MAVRLAAMLLSVAAALVLLASGGAQAAAAVRCTAKHCAVCTPGGGGGRTCELCHIGFYADKRGICRKCTSPNCADCTQTGNCAICKKGFGSQGGRCKRCRLANCMSCNDSPNSCQQCATGHGLVKRGNKTTCIKCTNKKCMQCDGNPAKCSACKGRLETAVNGTCVAPAGNGGNLLGKDFGSLTGDYDLASPIVYTYLEIKVDLPWPTTSQCILYAKMGSISFFVGKGKAWINLAKDWDADRFCRTYMDRTGFGFGGGVLIVGGLAPSTEYGGKGVWDVFLAGLSLNAGAYGTASWEGCQCR